jgi:hypothetical protein
VLPSFAGSAKNRATRIDSQNDSLVRAFHAESNDIARRYNVTLIGAHSFEQSACGAANHDTLLIFNIGLESVDFQDSSSENRCIVDIKMRCDIGILSVHIGIGIDHDRSPPSEFSFAADTFGTGRIESFGIAI